MREALEALERERTQLQGELVRRPAGGDRSVSMQQAPPLPAGRRVRRCCAQALSEAGPVGS
jgi:hypothetical protein